MGLIGVGWGRFFSPLFDLFWSLGSFFDLCAGSGQRNGRTEWLFARRTGGWFIGIASSGHACRGAGGAWSVARRDIRGCDARIGRALGSDPASGSAKPGDRVRSGSRGDRTGKGETLELWLTLDRRSHRLSANSGSASSTQYSLCRRHSCRPGCFILATGFSRPWF